MSCQLYLNKTERGGVLKLLTVPKKIKESKALPQWTKGILNKEERTSQTSLAGHTLLPATWTFSSVGQDPGVSLGQSESAPRTSRNFHWTHLFSSPLPPSHPQPRLQQSYSASPAGFMEGRRIEGGSQGRGLETSPREPQPLVLLRKIHCRISHSYLHCGHVRL